MKKHNVILSGYVSMDHIIKIKSPVTIGMTSLVENKTNSKVYYGGCSVNIAYALCKLGLRALPIIRVGEDYEETGFYNFLREGNVPLDGISIVENESTSTCYLLQDNNNDHITIFYPGAMDGKYSTPLNNTLFKNKELAVMTVASLADNKEFLCKCKENNIPLVFGMKVDCDAFTRDFLKEALSYSKIIFTNEIEREIIEKDYGFENITDLFIKGNAEVIITTLGKEGSLCHIKTDNGFDVIKIGVSKVDNVVDATGSGDAYIAGFIYGYLNKYEIKDCCKLGGVLSSFVLKKEGCCTNIPSEELLLDEFKNVKEVF